MKYLTQTQLFHKLVNKLVLLYILNCFDILFTYTLLKTGNFFEANFFMRHVVTNPYLSILIKVIFPAILIIGVIPHLNDGILLVYAFINCCHIFYTLSLFF